MFHNQFQNQKVCEIFNNKIVISERVIIYYINSRRISPTPPFETTAIRCEQVT